MNLGNERTQRAKNHPHRDRETFLYFECEPELVGWPCKIFTSFMLSQKSGPDLAEK